MKTHVLIGFAEAVPAPEVLFDLRAAGHKISCFARTGSDALILKHLPFEAIHYIRAPEKDTQGATADLADVLSRFDGVILPLDDTGLWLVNAARDAMETPPPSAGATGAPSQVALDKIQQIEAARAAGLAVPSTIIVKEASATPTPDQLPAIAKPAGAISLVDGQITKGDVTYLMAPAEVERLHADIAIKCDPLLIQPLIHGRGEGVFGFRLGDEVTNWSGHYRVRMMNPHGSGSSACQTLMPDDGTKQKISAFLKAIDWQGPFMMEFLRDADDTLWFMELNGRMWGSLALARRSGYSYPAWAVARCLDPAFVPPEIAPPQKPVIQRHLGRDLLHLVFVLRGPKSDFHRTNWPIFWQSLKGVLAPTSRKRFYNYDPDFPNYFWKDALKDLRKKLLPRRAQ